MRVALLLSLLILTPALGLPALAQESSSPATGIDIPTLLHEVEAHQKAAEQAERNYLYKVTTVRNETDSRGNQKKTNTIVSESLTLRGIRVNRVLSKNGKPLTEDEQKKEIERIDKAVNKANERLRAAEAKGKDVTANGDDEVTVSRFLQLGAFTNPRREMQSGRALLAVDFTGDPKAKTRNRAEELIRDLTGTIWIDEHDRTISRIQGHAMKDYKIGFGVVADLKRNTNFDLRFTRINDEVWLPAQFDLQGSLHYLLFFSFTGNVHIGFSDYRKFKTTATVLSITPTDQSATEPDSPLAAPAPAP